MTKWAEKHSRDIKNAYSIAISNGYNIKSTEDVLKILKKTNPEKVTEGQAEEVKKNPKEHIISAGKVIKKPAKPVKPTENVLLPTIG